MNVGEVRIPDEIPSVRELFREYQSALGIDLCFQGFDAELATLPGAYAPPGGDILLARCDGELVGCVAFRPLEPGICELKRLYVRPTGRGLGVGRRLVLEAMGRAREAGHGRMRLDTLPAMVEAQALYRSLGFHEIPPFNVHPLPGTLFLERKLD